jgi:hypothetical protein
LCHFPIILSPQGLPNLRRRIRQEAASAGAEGGEKTPAEKLVILSFASLRDQRGFIVKVSAQSINSGNVRLIWRQFNQIQADSSEFKQIQPQTPPAPSTVQVSGLTF